MTVKSEPHAPKVDASTSETVRLARGLLTPNYQPAPVIFTHGRGVHLFDTDNGEYLDFAAGIAVCALGHGHPGLAGAISEQAGALLHVSNLYFTQPEIDLAQRLVEQSFADRVFFCNSGTEANEAALKLARRYMRVVRKENRFKYVCAHASFHGRTFASLSATGQPKYHAGFEPLVPGFVHVPYNDLAAVEAAIDDETCAVFVEPIQGEGGIIVPDAHYLPGLRKLCDARGVLLIFDEVQTGVGRTGRLWAHQHWDVTPDIMTLAKGLAGGVPIGAMLCTEALSHGFMPGSHASTFGGNPLACRAAATVLDAVDREGLVEHAERVGVYLREALTQLVDRHEGVIEPRGLGLLAGVAVDTDRVDPRVILGRCRRLGLLITIAGGCVLRMVPPLIASRSHVDEAIGLLERALNGEGEE